MNTVKAPTLTLQGGAWEELSSKLDGSHHLGDCKQVMHYVLLMKTEMIHKLSIIVLKN